MMKPLPGGRAEGQLKYRYTIKWWVNLTRSITFTLKESSRTAIKRLLLHELETVGGARMLKQWKNVG